jgi:hypothetical protein
MYIKVGLEMERNIYTTVVLSYDIKRVVSDPRSFLGIATVSNLKQRIGLSPCSNRDRIE